MKNSGIEWIGEIPDSWQLIKIGSIFACRNEKVSDSEFSPLSVSRCGVVPQMENVAKSDAGDNRKLVLKNDFVINSRSDRKQSCGVSSLDGSVSLINTVLYPIAANVIIPEYANVVMKNYGFAEEFYRWGHGIVADLWTTRWQEMKSIVLPLPTIDTQVCIIKDLSQKLTEVDKLVEVQQAQIEKLKEYKQSVITEAVTKGLDPTAPMKDSGVEWIGKIPEGWNVKGIKKVASFVNGYAFASTEFRNEGVMVLKITNVQPQEMVYDNLSYVDEKYYDKLTAFRLNKGDLLFALTRPIINGGIKVGIYLKDDICLINQRTAKLQPKSNLNSKWIMYLCCVKAFLWEYSLLIDVTGLQPNISANDILTIKIPLPKIEMQKEIIAYLDDKCAKIDKLIALKQSKIEKLQEYKKSLIYEYVTGKKEVV